MARKIKIFGLIVSALMIGRLAFGADLEASKVADLQKIVNNSFATVDLRHYSMTKMTDNEVDGTTPWLQSRGTIGTSMLNDAFVTYAIFGATKNTETTRVDARQIEWDSKLTVLRGKFGEITPYLNLYLPYKSPTTGKTYGTNGDIGIYNEAKLPMETAWGNVTVLGSVDFCASQSSRNEKVGIERRDPAQGGRFSLDETEETKINKRDPSMATQYLTSASFSPSILKGFSVVGAVYFTTEFEPEYREEIVDGDTTNELRGYAVAKTTTNQVTLAYKATDRVTFANDTYQRFNGFFEGRRDGGEAKSPVESGAPRWGNRLMVTYTLF